IRTFTVYEVDAIVEHVPVSPAGESNIQNSFLVPSGYRNLPDAIWILLRIVDEITVGGLECGEPVILCELDWISSQSRNFPKLPVSAAIGSKVNPLSVARPARNRIFVVATGDLLGRPAVCIDN